MKLILIEDVKDLGSIGDAIEVKDGYARNYLLPRSLALKASDENLKVVEKSKQKKALKLEQIKQQAKELAQKIAAASCTIAMASGEDDKLFGSVTTQNIVDTLKQENIVVDKKCIMLQEPINKLGIYNIQLKLHPEVAQELKVWVIKK